MIYKEIKDLLKGFPEIGEPFFVGYVPNTSEAAAIIPTGGTQAQVGFDVRSNRSTFQIKSRAKNFETGYKRMQNIYKRLVVIHGPLGNSFVNTVIALQSDPISWKSEQDDWIFTQNYLISYRVEM